MDKRKLRDMNEVECAYLGALMDGEGCALVVNKKYWSIRISNTEPELVSAPLRITGKGSVNALMPSYGGEGDLKPQAFVWILGVQEDIAELAARVAPYSMKMQKILANPVELIRKKQK